MLMLKNTVVTSSFEHTPLPSVSPLVTILGYPTFFLNSPLDVSLGSERVSSQPQFKQIVRVSLKLIANSSHINDETSFSKTRFDFLFHPRKKKYRLRFGMKYHTLLTSETFQLSLRIQIFNRDKNDAGIFHDESFLTQVTDGGP